MTEQPAPTVGRIVHYVSYGTPGGEYGRECRAAIVTEVGARAVAPPTYDEVDAWVVGLCVLNPTGQFFNRGVEYHDGSGESGREDCPTESDHGNPLRYCGCGWTEDSYRGGTWHWPERT